MAIADGSVSAAGRLAEVRRRIERAAKTVGRDPGDVSLIAVSKTFGTEDILPLLETGQRVFGENRVQEAAAKWPPLLDRFPDVELHLIGQLQSNKAEMAARLFRTVHSLDRLSLVSALARTDPEPDAFVQINIGEEAQKGGCAIADAPLLVDSARAAGLRVRGLMCVPPAGVEAAPYFALLAKMAQELGAPELSMGMSGDFETAVMLGATQIRVGSALFGTRAGG